MNKFLASTALIALVTMGVGATAHADTVTAAPAATPVASAPAPSASAVQPGTTTVDSQKAAVEPGKDVSGTVKTDKTDKPVGKTSQLKSHHVKAQSVKATAPVTGSTKAAQ